MSKVSDGIKQGLRDAIAISDGTAKAGTYKVHVPESIDVKEIRSKLGMSRQEFASRFGFAARTLEKWERGERQPEGPTRAYLKVIDRDPEAVQKALVA